MRTIMLEYPLQKEAVSPSVIALGCFDGIHLAHEKLIKTTIQLADQKGINSSVMTFDPHPEKIIFGKKVDYLMPFEEKQKKLAEIGIDTLYVIRFNKEVSKLPPKRFIEEFLVRLQAKHIVVGFDFTYGYKAKGNVNTLSEDGDSKFGMTVIPKIEHEGEKIGSTQIRELVKEGLVDKVPDYLGDYYSTKVFVKSKKLKKINGKSLVHISPFNEYQFPLHGDYEVEIDLDGVKHQGVVSKVSYFNDTFHLEFEAFISKLPKTFIISWLRKVDSVEASSLSG